MKAASALKESIGKKWIPAIYSEKVRSLRTRAYSLGVPPRENEAEILHTLLGVELKVGRRRLSCPDLSTARYLRIFARIGVGEIAVPYDISKIAALADELESAWQYALLVVEQQPLAKKSMRSALVRSMRREITEIGAGRAMPEFKQTTKQEKYHQSKK